MDTQDSKTPPESSSARTMRDIGALSTLGIAFVLAIGIGFGGGYLLDRWLGTHWLWVPGFVLGVAAAIVNVYRTASRL